MAFNGGWEYTDAIGRADVGLSPAAFYARHYRHTSEEGWRRRIAHGEIRLNGLIASGGERLASGDTLLWRRPPWNEGRFLDDGVAIIYEDDSIIAVDKPAGLSTMPDGGWLENSLVGWLDRRYSPGAVAPAHRLNRGTSGIVLCARTPQARASLARQFLGKTLAATGGGAIGEAMEKTYIAATLPLPGRKTGDRIAVEKPIGPVKHPVLGRVFAANSDGKPARSECEIVAADGAAMLWRVKLCTGRPHQIRIHLASIGAPLLGDPLFLPGGRPNPFALPGECGYFLRAVKIAFIHPATGVRVVLEADLLPHSAPPIPLPVGCQRFNCASRG